jgi:hypothetical protein
MKYLVAAVMGLAIAGCIEGAAADPWKDESGKNRWRGDYSRYDDDFDRRPRRNQYRGEAGIPQGHLPPPGECRTWYPGVPPGHQPPPYRC